MGEVPEATGSSPRAWGILLGSHERDGHPRFIPTCVGNTSPAAHLPQLAAVHPHVRGEYRPQRSTDVVQGGSSPRAWGIHCPQPVPHDDLRFIPTCVGNTTRQCPSDGRQTVHPHVRGEYRPHRHRKACGRGSSPRAWGIRGIVETDVRPQAVHPHVRGEYGSPFFFRSRYSGSSPRAWGIRRRRLPMPLELRFIPTCVGNTGGWHGAPCSRSVHPHVRGEYDFPPPRPP